MTLLEAYLEWRDNTEVAELANFLRQKKQMTETEIHNHILMFSLVGLMQNASVEDDDTPDWLQ